MSDDDEKPPAPPVRLTSNRYVTSECIMVSFDLRTALILCYYKNFCSFRLARGDSSPNIPVDMRPLPKEPDFDEKKKKSSKNKPIKIKGIKVDCEKPNISYPTNFEHTVHVGFDAFTGEFTVSFQPYVRGFFVFFDEENFLVIILPIHPSKINSDFGLKWLTLSDDRPFTSNARKLMKIQ